jgi:predicted esterase
MASDLYRLFGNLVPESLSVTLAAAGMLVCEGKLRQASALGGQLRSLYSEMKKDSQVLQMLKSRSVDACLTPGDKHGHYYLRHVPKAPVMVFLHGYGGNLLFNIWAMMKALPDWTLIHPSWGLDWWLAETENKMSFLQDLAKDYAQHTGEPLRKPWLGGLSDGGMAAFELASAKPQHYSGLISLASSPNTESHSFPVGYPIFMINGTEDDRFPIDQAMRSALKLLESGVKIQIAEMKGEDHFFLLSSTLKMGRAISAFVVGA